MKKIPLPTLPKNWRSFWISHQKPAPVDMFHNDDNINYNNIIIKQGRLLGAGLLLAMMLFCFIGSFGFIANQIQSNINNNARSSGLAISNAISKYAYYGLEVGKIRNFDQEVRGYFESNPSLFAIAITDSNDEIVQQYVRDKNIFDFTTPPAFSFDYYSADNKEGEVKVYLKEKFFTYMLQITWLELVLIFIASILVICLLVFLVVNGKIWQRIIFILDYLHGLQRGDYRYRLPANNNNEIGQLESEINQYVESRNHYYFDIQQETIEASESQIDPQNANALQNILESMQATVQIGKLGQPQVKNNIKEIIAIPSLLLMVSLQLLWVVIPLEISNNLRNSHNNYLLYIAFTLVGFGITMTFGKKYALFFIDRLGLRTTSVAVAVTLSVMNFLLFLSHQGEQLMFLRVFSGFGYGILWTICQIILFKPNDNFNEIIGMNRFQYYMNAILVHKRMALVSMALGVLYAGIIGQLMGSKWVFLLSALVVLGLAVFCVFIESPTISKHPQADNTKNTDDIIAIMQKRHKEYALKG